MRVMDVVIALIGNNDNGPIREWLNGSHDEEDLADVVRNYTAGGEGEFWHVQHRVNPASRCGVAFDELLDFQERHDGRLTR